MNPDVDQLDKILSRGIPHDLLSQDKFKQVLKEKARNSMPSSSEESMTEKTNSAGKARAKRGGRAVKEGGKQPAKERLRPANLVDPLDRDMIPHLEKRATQIEKNRQSPVESHFGVELEQPPPPPASVNEFLPKWLTWQVIVVLILVLVVVLFIALRQKIIQKLGLVHALSHEFPSLAPFFATFSGGKSPAEILKECEEFYRPPKPALEPEAVDKQEDLRRIREQHQKQKEQERGRKIEELVEESVNSAHEKEKLTNEDTEDEAAEDEDTEAEETKAEETEVEEAEEEEVEEEEEEEEVEEEEEEEVEVEEVEETKVEETKAEETKAEVEKTKVEETKVEETKVEEDIGIQRKPKGRKKIVSLNI